MGAWWLLVLAALAIPLSASQLSICLEQDSPPYSYQFGGQQGGFDRDLANALAKALGATLRIQWFEFEVDEDEVTTLQARALLADQRCHLIGGYPLLEGWLGNAKHAKSVLPDYAGKARSKRHRQVVLAEVAASKPYLRTQFGVIVTPAFRKPVYAIDDLEGVPLIVEIQSLPAIILWQHKNGLLMDSLTHVAPTKGLLKQLEAGAAAATLIEVHRFDRYRFRNPSTQLRWSGYAHPIGYNLGFAGLASEHGLLEKVNEVLSRFADDGKLEELAERNGLTYFAPTKPYVAGKLVIR